MTNVPIALHDFGHRSSSYRVACSVFCIALVLYIILYKSGLRYGFRVEITYYFLFIKKFSNKLSGDVTSFCLQRSGGLRFQPQTTVGKL
jgi:hypothetical protein